MARLDLTPSNIERFFCILIGCFFYGMIWVADNILACRFVRLIHPFPSTPPSCCPIQKNKTTKMVMSYNLVPRAFPFKGKALGTRLNVVEIHLAIFCKYRSNVTRAFWVRWTDARGLNAGSGYKKTSYSKWSGSRGMYALINAALDNSVWFGFKISVCRYLVPGMSHYVKLLSWVHILQMWMLQMSSMFSARYSTDQYQKNGQLHYPSKIYSIVKLKRRQLASPLLSIWALMMAKYTFDRFTITISLPAFP